MSSALVIKYSLLVRILCFVKSAPSSSSICLVGGACCQWVWLIVNGACCGWWDLWWAGIVVAGCGLWWTGLLSVGVVYSGQGFLPLGGFMVGGACHRRVGFKWVGLVASGLSVRSAFLGSSIAVMVSDNANRSRAMSRHYFCC